MRDNTYHRWMTMFGGGEPLWPVARAHVRALTLAHVREPDGELQEWALIDEVLGLVDTGGEDVVAELANVRAQLLEDLDDLRNCWTSGHPDVCDESREDGRQLFAGGALGPDWEYPNAMTGCLARLIGSGTARVAGFHSDEDEGPERQERRSERDPLRGTKHDERTPDGREVHRHTAAHEPLRRRDAAGARAPPQAAP